jgi:hypothetical protein
MIDFLLDSEVDVARCFGCRSYSSICSSTSLLCAPATSNLLHILTVEKSNPLLDHNFGPEPSRDRHPALRRRSWNVAQSSLSAKIGLSAWEFPVQKKIQLPRFFFPFFSTCDTVFQRFWTGTTQQQA